jgi:hypothetical protein
VLLRFSDSPQPSVAAQIRQRKSPITAALAGVIACIFSGEKTKNHRQGIAGGFGGLASSRAKALLKTKRQPTFHRRPERRVPNEFT